MSDNRRLTCGNAGGVHLVRAGRSLVAATIHNLRDLEATGLGDPEPTDRVGED